MEEGWEGYPTEKRYMCPYICIHVAHFHHYKLSVSQSCPTLCNPMDCTCQAPLSMEFLEIKNTADLGNPRAEAMDRVVLIADKNTGVGLLFPSPGDLPNPGTESRSPSLQVNSLPSEPPVKRQLKIKNKRVGRGGQISLLGFRTRKQKTLLDDGT